MNTEVGLVMKKLSTYMAGALEEAVPTAVAEKAKHHILDTLGAMVSGTRLRPGQFAIRYIRKQGGLPEALVVGSDIITSAANAALANGMLAHADETDDSHAPSLTHPGCAVIPAALAMAEKNRCSGESLLKAVVLGYDIGCRTTRALGVELLERAYRSTHTIGGQFGAAAAAGALAGLNSLQIQYLLSYIVQQASGIRCWVRDEEHIQKAFVFGGMPAHNGVMAATMASEGFTGVSDALSGSRNFFEAFSPDPDPEIMTWDLGKHYEISLTNIKKWPVGSPIQAAIDAVLELRSKYNLEPSNVKKVVIKLPTDDMVQTVDNRKMPDINLQYCVATTLIDGHLTFDVTQDYSRMNQPEVLRMRNRIELVKGDEFEGVNPGRQAIAEITTYDGHSLSTRVRAVRGTADNPMERIEVIEKASDLLVPVLGEDRAQELIDQIMNLEELESVSDLRPLLRG